MYCAASFKGERPGPLYHVNAEGWRGPGEDETFLLVSAKVLEF